MGYEGWTESINSIQTTNLIIIIYEIERRKKNQKESYYVLMEERKQMKWRRECDNSQITNYN